MIKNFSISTVVVTYNRKNILRRCLQAIAKQTYKPKDVYIVDNASTDGTMEYVQSMGLYNETVAGIQYHYIRNKKNLGGAGGFYVGMKTAIEQTNSDALWVMDDDGEPAPDCLHNMLQYLGKYHFLSPLVVSSENRKYLSFTGGHELYTEFQKKAVDGVVKGWVNPFNGVLFSCELIEKIGYPKKEMFIWGDEINYELRSVHASFERVCVVDAIHYHPLCRQKFGRFNGVKLPNIEQDWKLYCFVRNKIYNDIYFKTYMRTPSLIRFFYQLLELVRHRYYLKQFILYDKKVLKRHRCVLIIRAAIAGTFGYFGGLRK